MLARRLRRSYSASVLVASWNVNSIRARQDLVENWLRDQRPDVVCLQETKVVDDDFPSEMFQRLGYALAVAGQRSYNGVAIASRSGLEDVEIGLWDERPGADRRLIAATVNGVRVFSTYVPNGKSVASPDFAVKLDFLERLRETLARKAAGVPVILCGDFNVALEPEDVYDPIKFEGQLHFHPDERVRLERLLELGLVDAFRIHEKGGGYYSWWDYRGASLRKNEGLRIDYVFLSRDLVERCVSVRIDAEARRLPRPSDHAPVIVQLSGPSAEALQATD